jgi:TPR repeat protein
MRAWLVLGSCLLVACATGGRGASTVLADATAAGESPDQGPTEGERALEAFYAPTTAACGRGDAVACLRLVQRFGSITNAREARWLAKGLASGCSAGVPIACAGEAKVITHGVGVPRDVQRGIASSKRWCDAGQGFACAELAEVYLEGKPGVAAMATEGRALARRTCETLGGWPCLSATAELQIETDGERYRALLGRACDGDDLSGCYQLGTIYTDGLGGLPAADLSVAKTLYTKACDGGIAGACFNLALATPTGQGASAEAPPGPDELPDRALLERACLLGDSSGCDTLARRDHDAARYCERWGADACYEVATEIAKKRGETAESAPDLVRAAIRAAHRGSYAGRNTLGHLFRDNVRWCDSGQDVKDSCTFAGLLYAAESDDRSVGAERDEATSKGRAALDRACAAGSDAACRARRRLGR